MQGELPPYLDIARENLGQKHSVTLSIVPDNAALARRMAEDMANAIRSARDHGRGATLIVPVGPVDQFPVLAELINAERLSLADTMLINMDEYLTDGDEWLPVDHPLSFRGFMDRCFYDHLDPALAPPLENRIFPDPNAPTAIQRIIDERRGVDACFGGIGINGHIAFNEPPEPGETMTVEEFAALPTRVLSLSRETRTINANTVGGSIDVVPARCVTVGMREILAARTLKLYCNRPWQSAVVRKVLFGDVSPACPASLMRTHPNASLTITELVAAKPAIGLR
ncbi:MAG: glucosamine-6-phosphate isomerase [Planctomycetota bacterium]|nr:MAG: glucosamine-6-phosphate isomerase [Planctomycetota bacterium]REJ86772.1 MAG: glucosamine-6-phosphate isomerase [Planctomycetota bacterium]REK20469.1 MAG: glucosamine-6-phosphate isomerase [Planctomycetota bacterium]REK33867.1 MAG: glucosamine-6-phosphate isomerase [Planctomycetota bacterium]